MKLCLSLKGLLLVVLCGFSSQNPISQDSFSEFSKNVYHNVVSTSGKDENVVISPVSIQTCVAMAYMGSTGQTASEMSSALSLDKFAGKDAVASAYQQFFNNLHKKSEVIIANRLYVAKNREFTERYNEITTKAFHAGVEKVDFSKNVEAAKVINDWVAQKTDNKIREILSADKVNGDTAAVLLNAIYFKADWLYPFKITKLAPFYVTPNVSREVQTMSNNRMQLSYTTLENFNADVIELPYKDSELKMYIILPTLQEGALDELEEKLSVHLLKAHSWLHGGVEVQLPKFKVEANIDLIPVLKEMGMRRAFEGGDFSDLFGSSSPTLRIDQVIHKAFIDVDELGTEATATTLVGIQFKSFRRPAKQFKVDRPFIFMISDDTTVYFQGRVVNP